MNKTAKNTIIYFIGTVVLAVFGFLNTMLLTRVLSPHVYALYGLFTTFGGAAVMIVALGMDASYMRFYYSANSSKKKFIMMCVSLPLLVFVVFFALMMEPNKWLVNTIFGEDISTLCIFLICIYVFLQVIQRFTQLSARMEEKAFNYIISNIVGKVGYVVLIFLFGMIGVNLGFDIIAVTFVITSFIAVAINLPILFSKQLRQPGNDTVTRRGLFFYGFPTCINSSLVMIIPVVERIVIRDLAGWELLSVYTAAAIFQTIVGLVTTMVDNIWSPIVYQKFEDKTTFKPMLHKFGLGISAFLLCGVAGVILLRRWLVLVLAKSYFDVMIIAPSIFFVSCLLPITSILGVGINIEKKTIHYIISPLIQIVISTTLCYALIPSMGLVGIGIAVLISGFVSRVYRIIVGLKYYDTGVKETKCMLLLVLGACASAFSLISTTFLSDVFICIVIIISVLVVMNTELLEIFKFITTLFKRNS